MAMLFTLLLGGCVAVLGYFSYYFNRSNFVAAAEKVIDADLYYLEQISPTDLLHWLSTVKTRSGMITMLRDPDGAIVAGSLEKEPQHITVLREGTILFQNAGRSYAAKIHIFDDGRALIVGMDITDAAHSYELMQWLSILSIAFMAIVILVSFFISSFVVTRTNRVAMTAKHMMDTGDLSQRIVNDSSWDDLGNMAFVLNAFLDRVDGLMRGIREVSDNIAHDLKAPLTRLYHDMEKLRSHPALAENQELSALGDNMKAEVGRLLDTFNALLRIAGIEAGRQKQDFRSVDVGTILTDVVEFYEPLAAEKNIRIDSEKVGISQALNGDRDLLFQAFANILDNAIKFTPEGGTVEISLSEKDKKTLVVIKDNGPGINDSDKPKVFERFFRADASRHAPGNGLGLALVAAVITLHSGEITIHDVSPGLRIEILF